MSDIMELVEKTLEDHYNYWIFKGEIDKSEKIAEESLSKLESRLSAMQEVCDAAILYNNGVMEICEFSNVVDGYTEAIKE